MIYVQTLSIHPKNNPYQNTYGWLSPEHHWMAWCLSCLQLRELGYSPVLHCNDAAAGVLIDDLKLPYQQVHATHNNFYLPDERLWALSKIHTYSLQTEPFLHIDGDVFLFQKLPESLLDAALIAQNVEEATAFYTDAQQTYMEHFRYFPAEVQADFFSGEPISALNAGILGGTNVGFFQEYALAAKEYVKRNEPYLNKVATDQFNVFFEQHLCFSMATKRGLDIGLLFEEAFKDNQYTGLANFHETPQRRSYLHLLGHFKRDAFACQEMAAHFRVLYPEYYYRVMECCRKKGADMKRSFFLLETNCTSLKQYTGVCQSAVNFFMQNDNEATHLQEQALNEWWEQKYQRAAEWISFMEVNDAERINIQEDLYRHKMEVTSCFNRIGAINEKWILGRELKAVNWWRQVFVDESSLGSVVLMKLSHTCLIQSHYNWGALFFSMHSEGRPFYESLHLEKGNYCSLLVPAPGRNEMAMYDIEDIEWNILEVLKNGPATIEKIWEELSTLADEDVLQHHLDEFRQMLLAYLEQLILKKAVCPLAYP